MVAHFPPLGRTSSSKGPGIRSFFEAWIFNRSDKAEEQMERDLRYEVERDYGNRAKINEVVLFFDFWGLFHCFFLFFLTICRLSLRHFFLSFLLSFFGSFFTSVTPSLSLLLTNLNYTFEPGRILGDVVFSVWPRTGEARRGSPPIPAPGHGWLLVGSRLGVLIGIVFLS